MRVLLLAVATFAVSTVPAHGQPLIAAEAGLISYSDGEVYLDGEAIAAATAPWPQVHTNGLLRSGAGRAEVFLNPCTVLHMGENSSLRMVASQLADTRVELLTGSAVLLVDATPKSTKATLMLKGSTVQLIHKGLYRFDTEPPRLKVFSGKASVERRGLHFPVSSGRAISLESPAPVPTKFDMRDVDALDRWSESRVPALIRSSGLANQQARQKLENEESARQAAAQEAQIHDPRSIHYDPLAPPPQVRPISASTPSGEAHVCAPFGR